MAASLRPPADAHDNISGPRHYSHHHACFPSLTEFPDSPSVYSHAYHSPDANTPSFSCLSDSTGCSEYDDESASTIRFLSTEDVQDTDLDSCADDASHRISLRGPRIRFHSRAPWETEDVIPPGEEPDNNTRSATIGRKLRGKASKADTLMRTLTRGSFTASRPSIDSTRSRVSATSSFEITAGNYSNSRGALYNLARESMSTSSLSSSATSASARQRSFAPTPIHSKSSHCVTQTHGLLPTATVGLNGMAPPSMTLERVPTLPSSSDTSPIGKERSASPPSVPSSQERQRDDFIHPYANPDLVVPYTPSPETIASHHLILGDMSGSDSNSTVADSTSVRSAAFSVSSTETSTTSLTSRDLPYGNPRVNGKEISSPISVLRQSDSGYVDRNTRFLSLHPPPTGFDGHHGANPRSPTVTLITLQEAQARERVRSNTVHTTVHRPNLPFPDADDILETVEDQAEEMGTVDVQARTRARSTSVGNRHTTATLPPAQVSEMGEVFAAPSSTDAVPGRALKHKKSGFMRLFTGRNSEGEKDKTLLPPVPPLANAAKQSSQTHGTGKISKHTLPRVSKPSFSPTLHAPNAVLTNSVSSGGDCPDGKGPSSRRRQPPSLSIVTKTSDYSISSSLAGRSSSASLNFTPPQPISLTVPLTAPPGDTDFPGLKLRPISTSFSSHFADIVAATVEERQYDVHTPSSAASSGTALSPFTPVSMRRSDDASATTVEPPGENYLAIKELQDQFVSAKKAWEQQIWELRGQIRDLTAELEDLRAVENQEYCDVCGRGKPRRRHASPSDGEQPKKVGVVNRPRARTGDAARFASGN